MKVAIVGSEAKYFDEKSKIFAMEIINTILDNLNPEEDFIVSGACPKGGIDIWAIHLAELGSFQIQEFPPITLKWEGKGGYRDRNTQIAKFSDVVISIDPNRFSGGSWTARHAAEAKNKEAYTIRMWSDGGFSIATLHEATHYPPWHKSLMKLGGKTWKKKDQ